MWNLAALVLSIGATGIVAQVVLTRELFVALNGNELWYGVILANWIAAEALGVWLVGSLGKRRENALPLVLGLQAFFLFFFAAALYLARSAKHLLGVPFMEAVGAPVAIGISCVVVLPTASSHGGLFSALCLLLRQSHKSPGHVLARVYALETIGTLIGGVLVTYALLPHFPSFQIVYFTVGLTFIGCLFLLVRKKKSIVLGVAGIGLLLAAGGRFPQVLEQHSRNLQWQPQKLIASRNSAYGSLAVTAQEGGQYTFFYNGLPVITTPHPDIAFVEEFAHLVLLSHPAPRHIALLGNGAGGLLQEILTHPLSRVDYAELDPLLIAMVREYPTELTRRELSDPRLFLAPVDGRLFLSRSRGGYDVILIGSSKPADLATNRLFTEEFFVLAKARLRHDGILGLWLPGSTTYLSPDVRKLDASILRALKAVYPYVRIIPSEQMMIVMGSASSELLAVTPEMLAERMHSRRITATLLSRPYLAYRLAPGRSQSVTQVLGDAPVRANRDFTPYAVFHTLVFWNRQFSGAAARFLSRLEQVNLMGLALVIALSVPVWGWLWLRKKKSSWPYSYAIATSGFCGMMATLSLLFSFQVVYGYVYQQLGLLLGLFMAGSALGSWWAGKGCIELYQKQKRFRLLEIGIGAFALALSAITYTGYLSEPLRYPLFMLLCVLPGFLLGWQFAVAGDILLPVEAQGMAPRVNLYAADLAGGWLAGMLGGVVFIPLWGIAGFCVVAALAKASSYLLLLVSPKR